MKLVLHYDGRNFYGWQAQRNRRTVQGELSTLLEQVCGGPPKILAAGRTDSGVHATGQVASALIPSRYDPTQLRRSLNALAPPDLWIASSERVAKGFHPRYDAVSRTYAYRVGVTDESGSPFTAPWCWPLGQPLDLHRMREASGALIGEHDFGAFAKSGQPDRGVRCRVTSAEWRRSPSPADDGILVFRVSADRFLHRMVRYLVGTLAEIGRERRPVDELAALLRREAGLVTASPAPAQGLFLMRVDYPAEEASV